MIGHVLDGPAEHVPDGVILPGDLFMQSKRIEARDHSKELGVASVQFRQGQFPGYRPRVGDRRKVSHLG